jgi:hypothetical protein
MIVLLYSAPEVIFYGIRSVFQAPGQGNSIRRFTQVFLVLLGLDILELIYAWRKRWISERLNDHDRHLRLLDNTLKINSIRTTNLTLDDTGQDLVQTSIVGTDNDDEQNTQDISQ